MNLMHRIIITLFLVVSFSLGQKKELKKITIIKSNNPVLNFNYQKLGLPDSINATEFSELKNYVLSEIHLESEKEPELFFELMEWVSEQWNHNGWHAAPDSLSSLGILKSARDEGEEYRCVEYGIVLNDILISFGYPARIVGLKNINADYGGAGMGHVATEVWSNNLQKWIFLDPQFGIYAKKGDVLLNILDIYKLKSGNKFDEIEFIEVKENKPNKKYGTKFLSNYLGYIDIAQKQNNLRYSLVLKMEGERDFLTFQAFPLCKTVFTKNVNDLYYELNRTMVVIDYTPEEIVRTKNEYSKLNIKSVDDFNKNMSLFCAKPDLILSLDNNMPWFKNYLVKLNDVLINKKDGKYYVNLKEGINVIKVTAVNRNNIEGISTVIKIKYE